MKRRRLFIFIICITLVTIMVTSAIVVYPAIAAALPLSLRNFLKGGTVSVTRAFKETFGISAVRDAGSDALEEIALDDEVSASPTTSNSTPTYNSISTSVPSVSDIVAVNDTGKDITNRNDGVASSPSSIAPVSAVQSPSSLSLSTAPTSMTIMDSFSPACAFPASSSVSSASSRKIFLNEIAWMGMPSSSAASAVQAGNREWIELKNGSENDVGLSGWEVANASGKMKITFGAQDHIPAGGFFLLLRGSTTLPYAHASSLSYSGDLRNAGDDLAVFDSTCGVSDFVGALANGWPAGNNTTKQTMERDTDGTGWHTSLDAGGTPGAENSVVLPPAHYEVVVAFEGNGGATITSNPAGMTCSATQCSGTFLEGTKLTLTEKPAAGALFEGWSGACSGKGKCSFVVNGESSLTALFRVPTASVSDTAQSSSPSESSGAESDPSTSTVSQASSTTPAPVAEGHVLIAAVQIAGASSTNDFVKLYNPSSVAVDMGGWKLRKRSATGADYSLREIPVDTLLASGHYFVWANSAGGFSASFGADISSTETLAGNNSVALVNADGNIEDALAWGTGTNQYGKGAPYPDNPATGQVLTRKRTGGVPVDTGQNADDFALQ